MNCSTVGPIIYVLYLNYRNLFLKECTFISSLLLTEYFKRHPGRVVCISHILFSAMQLRIYEFFYFVQIKNDSRAQSFSCLA